MIISPLGRSLKLNNEKVVDDKSQENSPKKFSNTATQGFARDKFYKEYSPILENRNAISRQSEKSVTKQLKLMTHQTPSDKIRGISEVPQSKEQTIVDLTPKRSLKESSLGP